MSDCAGPGFAAGDSQCVLEAELPRGRALLRSLGHLGCAPRPATNQQHRNTNIYLLNEVFEVYGQKVLCKSRRYPVAGYIAEVL